MVKLLLYGSLITSFVCLFGIFVIKMDERKLKRYLVFSSVGFYLLFGASAIYIYSVDKGQVTELTTNAEAGESQPTAEASVEVAEVYVTKVADAPKIDVKIRMTPGRIQKPNQKVVLQFLVTNKSEVDIVDLRMKFSKGELSDYFYFEEVKGNDKVYVFDNIVTLGDLQAGEERKVHFDLVLKNNIGYSGEIMWQVGNNYIADSNTNLLSSLIQLPLDEAFEAGEESDFEDFDSLKSVSELEEEELVVATEDSNNPGDYTDETAIDQTDGISEEDNNVVREAESEGILEEAYPK